MCIQPYLMSKEAGEVGRCREAIQGNNTQTRATRGCMTGAISASQRLDWLHFGVRVHLMNQVEALRRGKTISDFARNLLLARLDRPVWHCDVCNQARRLGLI